MTSAVRIPLVSRKYPGLFALVDEEDRPLVAGYAWRPAKPNPTRNPDGTFYAQTTVVGADGKPTTILMHRVILGLSKGQLGDHVNGDGLDNRRRNLRRATPVGNGANRGVSGNNTSGFKGVYRTTSGKPWGALIQPGNRKQHLGAFDTPEEAARAYDAAARRLWDEFARTNFPATEVDADV